MEIVKKEENIVPADVFAEMKRLIISHRKAAKRKGANIQRMIRRALIKKYPQIPKAQWEKTFPLLFVTITKQVIKPKQLPN